MSYLLTRTAQRLLSKICFVRQHFTDKVCKKWQHKHDTRAAQHMTNKCDISTCTQLDHLYMWRCMWHTQKLLQMLHCNTNRPLYLTGDQHLIITWQPILHRIPLRRLRSWIISWKSNLVTHTHTETNESTDISQLKIIDIITADICDITERNVGK